MEDRQLVLRRPMGVFGQEIVILRCDRSLLILLFNCIFLEGANNQLVVDGVMNFRRLKRNLPDIVPTDSLGTLTTEVVGATLTEKRAE